MKKIVISFSVIAVVAVVAIGATTAFFSDTETSTGNVFTAGAIDLQIDSTASYNGQPVVAAIWGLKDLVPTADKFFDFSDIKPGDSGENTISLHVINNDAWVCAEVSNLISNDNGLTEPESSVDDTDGIGQGELADAMVWKIWRDDGDNEWETGEEILTEGHPVNGVLPVYDSVVTPSSPLVGGETAYLGVAWSLPYAVGNEVQTDSLTGDISFYVEQARNNEQFVCGQKTLVLENKNSNWEVISDNTQGTLTYNVAGSEFNYSFEATGLVDGSEYSLIYYADKDDRFVDWGGNNPGALIGTFTATGGSIALASGSINLGMDLPHANDWNGTGAANYCASPDFYSVCRGAKIWLVPSSDYTAPGLTAWNPETYLFETDLIIYNDTDL